MSEKTELEVLKERADKMQIQYHPSIGVDKLREKVNAAIEGTEVKEEVSKEDVPMTLAQQRVAAKKESLKLVRFKLTCMNPNKKNWDGEFFTVSNSLVGTVKRYIPFNTSEPWHCEKIIFDHLKERKCQVFYNHKLENGKTVRKGKLINEFAISEMEPLTEEELKELAQIQQVGKNID